MKSSQAIIAGVYEERLTLPSLRPPGYKVSFWTILRECIGKDLSRITMPIYFNLPLSNLQISAGPCEYNYILDAAAE